MFKKFLKELFLIIIVLFIIVDLRLYTPILKLSEIIVPRLYYHTNANVAAVEEERWRMVVGGVYTKYTTIEYTVENRKYVSRLYFRSNDTEGGIVNINICKVFPNIFFRDNVGIPTTSEIVLLLILFEACIKLYKIERYESWKVKNNNDYIKKARSDMPQLYKFLKKNKAIDLLNEIVVIKDKYDVNELNRLGLFLNDYYYNIISQTEREWENGHKLDYIIIGNTDDKTILYKIDEGFIYSYNKKTFKYTFEAGGLVKYLKFLGLE